MSNWYWYLNTAHTGFKIHQTYLIEKDGPICKQNIFYFLLWCSLQVSLLNCVKRCFLFIIQNNYAAFGTEELADSTVCSLSYIPLYISTPEGGATLFWAAQRNEPNIHQFQPVLGRMCVCKGSFVWSLTVFPASLPFRGSSPSWKGPCSWSLDWFTLNPSDLSVIWEPFEHTSASTRLTL